MRITWNEAAATLKEILTRHGVPEDRATLVAETMATTSLEGVYSHGINRFCRLVRDIDAGNVDVNADMERAAGFGALERWDGKYGLGIVNAARAIDRATELAAEHGIGCVALAHTSHWLRGGTYAIRACERGFAAICVTNTGANMPTWDALDARLGNNPLVLGFPRAKGPIIVDMAMSQFAYGKLELAKLNGEMMPIDAGFDENGNLTRDPEAILKTRRILPTGSWKGAALSFALDVMAAGLALGNTVGMVEREGAGIERGLTQLFIAMSPEAVAPRGDVEALADQAVEYLLGSAPADENARIHYPGQSRLRAREANSRDGIPIHDDVWRQILAL